MNIRALPLGDYQTNCYIVWQAGNTGCLVIDPGYCPETILETVNKLGLQVAGIALTHGHFDHVGGVRAIYEATHCAVWMREADWRQFDTPENRFFYPLANCGDIPITLYEENDAVTAGGVTLHVLETPGHTFGSVCLIGDGVIFSGDTLFARSCGRTDLPGGDWEWLCRSLARLAALPGDYRVLPGHGGETTLEVERKFNPYMKGTL